MTASDFVEYIRELAYPTSLSEVAITRAFNDATIDLGLAVPAIRTGTFSVVFGQDVYDVFGRDDPSSPDLVDGNGFRAIQVTWSIQPDHSSDPFFQGPFLGPYNGRPVLPFTQSSALWRPSDNIIFVGDLEAVREDYFNAGWEQVDSDPRSPIRLVPSPGDNGVAGIRYAAYRDQTEYIQRAPKAYVLFAEARCCRTLARMFSLQAGVEFGPFKSDGSAVKYWSGEADRLEKQAKSYLDVVGFQELPVGTRSGVGGG